MAFLELSDLEPFASIDAPKAQAMIDDAIAMAELVAPCMIVDGFQHRAAVKAILRGAVLRWHEAGTGAVSAQTSGPFSQTLDTRQERRGMFWPSEINQLQDLCRLGSGSTYTTSLAGAGRGSGYWSQPNVWTPL